MPRRRRLAIRSDGLACNCIDYALYIQLLVMYIP